MKNEISTREAGKPPMTPVQTRKTAATSVEAADIQIAKILLMQGISERVIDGGAAAGDFIDSLTGDKMGDAKTPVQVIPITFWKDFMITEQRNGKFEFKEIVPYTSANSHWREFDNRSYTEGGVAHERNLRMNFLVLLASNADEVGANPYIVCVQRTGIKKAGMSFMTAFNRLDRQGKPLWSITLDLGTKLEKGKKGPYYVPVLCKIADTPDVSLVTANCEEWKKTFESGAATVDERDAVATEEGDAAASTTETDTRF